MKESALNNNSQQQIAEQTLELEINETKQIINQIRDQNGWYDFQAINLIIGTHTANMEDLLFIEIKAGEDNLSEKLDQFLESRKKRAIIPLRIHDNHFVGIYVQRNQQGNGYEVSYINPTGENIDANIAQLITRSLRVPAEQIAQMTNKIQHKNLDGTFTNVHCGAFTAEILIGLTNGNYQIHNDRLIENGRDLGDLSEEESNQFGNAIRKNHLELLGADSVIGTQDLPLSSISPIEITPQKRSATKKPKPFNYDDSSDEEGTKELVGKYDLSRSLGAIKNEQKKSFLLHSLGVEILYSEPVNEAYYDKKTEILSEYMDIDEQKEWFRNELKKELLSFLSYEKPDYESDDDFVGYFEQEFSSIRLKSDYSLENYPDLENFVRRQGISTTSAFNDLLKLMNNYSGFNSANPITAESSNADDIESLQIVMDELKSNRADYPFFLKKREYPELAYLFREPFSLLQKFLGENPDISRPNDLQNTIIKNVIDDIFFNFVEDHNQRSNNPSLFYDSDPDLDDSRPVGYPFGKNVQEWLEAHEDSFCYELEHLRPYHDEPGLYYQLDMYLSEDVNLRDELREAMWLDIKAEIARLPSGNVEHIDYDEYPALQRITNYFDSLQRVTRAYNRVSENIKFYKKKNPTEETKAKSKNSFVADVRMPRKTLLDSHNFSSQNFVDFLSNLRLANRSQKRLTRELQDDKREGIRMMEGDKKEVSRSWNFGEKEEALETQRIVLQRGNKYRRDEVLNLGNYAQVYRHIEDVKKALNKDDKFIAQQFRDIISGRGISEENTNPRLRQTLTSLAYLLFGTEVARNPAHLIAVQMAIDLIIAGKATWKQALDQDQQRGGGFIPMTMQDAVSGTRLLQRQYSNSLPFPYNYDRNFGGKDASDELKKREESIVARWTRVLHPELRESKSYEDFARVIKSKYQEWYGNSFGLSEPVIAASTSSARPESPKTSPKRAKVEELEKDGTSEVGKRLR